MVTLESGFPPMEIMELKKEEMRTEVGACWTITLPLKVAMGDVDDQKRSTVRLFQDGRPLGPPHALHDDIRSMGKGLYSHWSDTLYFSTRDNADPRSSSSSFSIEFVPDVRALESALESVTKERDLLRSIPNTVWISHRPPEQTGGIVGISKAAPNIDDADLVRRITTAFRKANATPTTLSPSMWTGTIAEAKRAEFQTMMEGSHADITKMLRNPRHTHLCVGFEDSLVVSSPWTNLSDPAWQLWERQWIYDCLVRLAEAVGSVRLRHPESFAPALIRDVEELLIGLDSVFGFKIQFPNLFPGEIGLQTERGVASFRAIQSLYQAWRIFEIVRKRRSAKILEIGAGLGRTAYFASQFGIKNYTLIDLPLTGVAQANFLGCVLGERWSHLVRQPAKVDSPMQRMIHHEDAETVFG